MLAPRRIHPVVRIAHRLQAPLRIAPRIILDHELVLILRGQGKLVFGGISVMFGPHDLFFIEPFVPHAFESEGVVEHLAVHFDFAEDVPAASSRVAQRRPYQVRLTQDLRIPGHVTIHRGDPLERAMFDIIAARALPGHLGALAASAHLLRAIVLLLEQTAHRQEVAHAGASADRVRIQRALAFVEEHLARKVSALDLAKAADTSASHFNRIFRQWSGTSPMEYLRHRRIEEARRLLANGELSIKQIAARTGFDDPFHFSRVFRRVDGLSPSQFRAAVLASGAVTT
jgi:AraC-like DNA-binding protein